MRKYLLFLLLGIMHHICFMLTPCLTADWQFHGFVRCLYNTFSGGID